MSRQGYNILTGFKATGNKAIDGVASCIIWHRERKVAIKSIYLKEAYYDLFRKGVEALQNRRLEEGELMQFDGVLIEKGSRFQRSIILPEAWTVENT